jgi:hypothetical protein
VKSTLANGQVIKTDSLRVDMDGGRIILSEDKSSMHEVNKRNWIQELIFYKKQATSISLRIICRRDSCHSAKKKLHRQLTCHLHILSLFLEVQLWFCQQHII